MVEAALVYPLLLLLVFSVLFAGLRLQEAAHDQSCAHKELPPREEGLLREETLLRTVWVVCHET